MTFIENEKKNTFCPYLAKSLTQIGPFNKEHVLPIGLGCPESFFVLASESENSRFNEEIDAPSMHDVTLGMLAVLANVRSRSGDVKYMLQGIDRSGEPLRATVSHKSVEIKHKNPVIKENGSIAGVRGLAGFETQAIKEAARIQRDFQAKKKKLPSDFFIQLENSSDLPLSSTSDLFLLFRQAIKTAYLFTVKTYSDDGILSKSGEIFRAAINARTLEELNTSGLLLEMRPPDEMKAYLPLKLNQHLLWTRLSENIVSTRIVLFGNLSFLFQTPRDSFRYQDGFDLKIIDASRQCFIDHPNDGN